MKHLHIHLHCDGLFSELRQIIHDEFQQLKVTITQEGHRMSVQLDSLIQRVNSIKDVAQSAAVTLRELRQQIIDAGTDPAKLQELTDSLAASELELSEAIANEPDSTP